MVRLKRTFRNKDDFINWMYRGTGKKGATPAQIRKLMKEINETKDKSRDGTVRTGYKVALKHKIIRLRKRN